METKCMELIEKELLLLEEKLLTPEVGHQLRNSQTCWQRISSKLEVRGRYGA